ncbi:hypothetical protein [Nocardia tengchongensis]|uniref:hypothetical protein n=1 Tax=Nocardia tengchongensis TaxID=2055889 RepID=UPI0036097004
MVDVPEHLRVGRAYSQVRRRFVDEQLSSAGISFDLEGVSADVLLKWINRIEQMILDWAKDEDQNLRGEADGERFVFGRRDVVGLLQKRQSRLLDRYAELARQEQLAEIRGAVEEKVEDPSVRSELSDLVSRVEQRQRDLDAKIQAQEDATAIEIRKLEVQERRWKMRKSLLEREPAAVLIGSLLLGVLTLALIIAMFIHTQVPEVLTSMVLLILGFFFGQTSGRGGRPD